MKSLGKSQGQNPRGRRPEGFWPKDFPRDSIHHDTPKAFPHTFILQSSRTSILGFKSTNGEGFMLSPFSSSVPRDTIGKSRDQSLRGLRPLGFWPWDFPRDSIHHDTPSAFPRIVPLYTIQQNQDMRQI